MRRGLPGEGGLGTLLVELFGTWVQYREFVAGDGPYNDDEDLRAQAPALSGDLTTVTGHLGAAVAGGSRATAILSNWSAQTTDPDLAGLVEGLQGILPRVSSPAEMLEVLVHAYESNAT